MSLRKRLLVKPPDTGITPSKHFGVVLYEGDGASGHSINGGKFGAAANFNGSDSIILTGLNTGNNNLTFSAWVNITAAPSQAYGMVVSGISHYYTYLAIGQNRKVWVTNDQQISGEADGGYATEGTTVLNLNTWYHIAGTLSSTGGAKIYVNGSLDITSSSRTANAPSTNEFSGIGCWKSRSNNNLSRPFNGKIDQVRVFTSVLSASQISTLYAETTPESLDPLSEDTTDTLQVLGDSSCTALYRFENNEDDESGNYNGTGTAIQYSAGRYGQGAIFSASDSKINIPDNFGAEGETVSYSLWFKTTSANGSYMFAKRTGNNTFHIRIDNSFSPAGKICVNNWAGTAQSANNAQSTAGGYNDGGWHHFVFTYDGNQTTKTKCFIDGVYDSGMDWTYDLFTQSVSGGNNIGNYDLGSSNFSGTIDQVRIFNKVLSASEVTTLYQENSLVASYRFEGNANDDMRSYDGTASNVSYEYGLNFTPDLVWIKSRSGTVGDFSHTLMDSTRGASKSIYPNLDNAEVTNVNGLESFDTGGFTVGSAAGGWNYDGTNYVAWCWKANGGTTSSNTDGSITSTVQVNEQAGFSIVKYTGDGSASSTVGHGLGVIPDLTIFKKTNGADWWHVFNTASNTVMFFNETREAAAIAGGTNGAVDIANMTSTIFGFIQGSSSVNNQNGNGSDYIAYCFKSIDGFSKIGTYTGNSSDNGPIVETGFEPAFLMIKNASDAGSWFMYDNKRNTSNPRINYLLANGSNVEASDMGGVDFLSNGFQIKEDHDDVNDTGDTYIYMAFAADPDTEAPTVAKSFSTVAYTGDGTSNKQIDLGFKPGLYWLKTRDTSGCTYHNLFDIIRGGNKTIYSNVTSAEVTNQGCGYIQSFDDNGVTYTGDASGINNNGEDFVAWAWKADDNEATIEEVTEDVDAIAIYKFEDNANDVTGNYNGTASNVTYSSSGKFNKAAEFNGSSSFINTGISNTTIPLSSNFSISAWINTNSSSGFFIAEGNFNSWSTAGFGLGLAGSNVVELSFGNNTSGGAQVQSSALAANTWHHIVGVVEIGNVLTLYVNGVSVGTNALTESNRTSVSGGFNIGADAGGYDYTGKLDQVRFYNKALTAASVTNLYNETTAQNDTLNIGTKAIVSIQSIVSANANAGFSIVKWEGDGVATSRVPHGLSAKPDMVIVKNLSSSGNWNACHVGLASNEGIALDLTAAAFTSMGSNGGITYANLNATTFGFATGSVGVDSVNKSGDEFIAYCFHSVSGYSKFGSYTGDGTTTKTITTGFQPDFVLIKVTDGVDNWVILDSVRGGSKNIKPNDSAAEATESGTNVEFISTGFKLIGSGPGLGQTNGNGNDYIYMAFKIN